MQEGTDRKKRKTESMEGGHKEMQLEKNICASVQRHFC